MNLRARKQLKMGDSLKNLLRCASLDRTARALEADQIEEVAAQGFAVARLESRLFGGIRAVIIRRTEKSGEPVELVGIDEVDPGGAQFAPDRFIFLGLPKTNDPV
jgi:hypothetical protein